ncbi:MAG: M2 family metallopeptidase, partial [Acidobacteria bacterium]|nr:M2 family metallopeptidase [Acidobacteriota bacterium]
KDRLSPLEVRQLQEVLYKAADLPQTVKDLVDRRIASEALQNEKLYGFDFQLDGASVSANDIDDRLDTATDLGERRRVWEASKEVGRGLKEGLQEMVDLRNRTVQALGYDDYFHYQVSDYGMETSEMMEILGQFVRDLWPLYRELHTWARYELARRYGADEVPALLPAHWLPNRWGQDWASLVKVEGLDLDPVLAAKEPEWLVRQGEEFYVSLGFDPLPATFWEKSSLYPAPPDADYKKNNHASAWHMDLKDDLRSLMSVQPNARWWATAHHELGHIYYYQAYSTPEVPILLRAGANRAFHEAIGTMLGMAASHQAFLEERGLIPAGTTADSTQALLREALDSVVFIPFSAGTMSHFERDLYGGAVDIGP